MKDDSWKEDVHRLVDEATGDLASLAVRAVIVQKELIAQGYSKKKATDLINAEVRKYAGRSLG